MYRSNICTKSSKRTIANKGTKNRVQGFTYNCTKIPAQCT